MSRYSALFSRLATEQRGALVPFVTLGDPGKALSLAIIETLIANGADALELGFPFSDPLADGPVIQGANLRARAAGVKVADCFEMISAIRTQHPTIPIGLLLYANLAYANGIDHFYQHAQAAGVDSILIADVPMQEAEPFVAAAKRHQIDQIFIAPPNSSDDDLQALAQLGSGYTYLLSRAGVTGADIEAQMPIATVVEKLKHYQAPPPLLGFGISQPEQVRAAIDAGAAGAISGSAVVNIIAKHLNEPQTLLAEMATFIRAMKDAT
ncbi:tryptophan synthase subunit alpha [Shewanella sp. NIFS-20-20]|uniref:tryptophan synthase subunit alpha n=1 Tax=Shewanella sp. NIFS-20-20 TaxID=2853806 RepID=UPI001C46292C|nr:tryptophan synthase subunit alpha [Shewanella sp. NIFS-20-20]MBV7315038.1 tryptophan synthase subunit alpha [Shewanella sp. NIFS-20-20]